MILPSDSTDDKLADLASSEPTTPDAPPPYTETASLEPPVERPSDITHLATSYDVSPLLTQRPCNWVYAYIANGLIQDQYILDPSLKVPNALLSDSVAGTHESERDALNLRSQTATIDAVARIVDSGGSGVMRDGDAIPRRVKIVLRSNTGTIMGKILSVDGSPPPKFHLTATSNTGALYIHIPRSFHGLISASSSTGSIHLCRELMENAMLTADGHTKKCFVGNYPDVGDDRGNDERNNEWDELRLESNHGAIVVEYADQWESKEREKEARRKMNEGKGLFGWLFGI
ncbi:hypothetical protein BDN71DRAFT_1499074 [Pleurotus eryngii]|uniref:DUF7330 domain-containing protein n=1 Tax=Pleurotus eryngii TaxID=5323 RepID=A0A9P6D387_PLEER|nr:hypothetical protein BDN71DRAFT_1499074 [Pleurotus eryngii]